MINNKTPDLASILTDANYLIHQIDTQSGALVFVHSSSQLLHEAAFIDGRSSISIDQRKYQLPLEQVIEYSNNVEMKPATRFIFHSAFCGSTLLARACSYRDKSFSYKEPQVLIDLANLKAKQHSWYLDKTRWQQLVQIVLQQLNKSWHQQQSILLKPSNWVNNLMVELLSSVKPHSEQSTAIFIQSSAKEFLLAVLRGGKERISFIYHLREHLRTAVSSFDNIIRQLDSDQTSDTQSNNEALTVMQKMVCNIMVVHEMQQQLFNQAQQHIKSEQFQIISYDQLMAEPLPMLTNICNTLTLGLNAVAISEQITSVFSQHAKQSEMPFDVTTKQNINSQVLESYGELIDFGLTWRDRNLLAAPSLLKTA